jgi:hypothetical protein
MKRRTILSAVGLPYLLMIIAISVFPDCLLSQNSAVRWSAFDMGFAMSVSSNTVVTSAIGQGFVGTIQQGNTRIESGFLADTSIRRMIILAVKDLWVPTTYLLGQNYPNPFNPSTKIQFSIPIASFTSLKVFNVLGAEIASLVSENRPPGTYQVTWDANGYPSGVYFYRLQAGEFTQTKKLVLVR